LLHCSKAKPDFAIAFAKKNLQLQNCDDFFVLKYF